MNSITIGKDQNSFNSLQLLKGKLNSLPINTIANYLGLELIQTGNSLQGQCPTGHPSNSGRCFSINLSENYWYCFNCGTGGDNIRLVEAKLNKGFGEAVTWLAEKFGIQHSVSLQQNNITELTDEELKKQEDFQIKAMLYEKAFEWMHNLLFNNSSGKEPLDYLINDRKYDLNILKQSDFCCFPSEREIRDYLLTAFPDAKKEICSLPLCGYYGDNFRLAIPYRNAKGQITGFIKRSTIPGGMKLVTKDGTEKEGVRWDSTFGLSKKDLFNLNKCKHKDTLVILEGYPDAVYFTALGMDNVVAVGQGRLSKNHLDGMKNKKIKQVAISFDNDSVGPKNTADAVKLLLSESHIIPFVLEPSVLTPHKDPDEFVRANGLDAYKDLLKKARKGSLWLTDQILKNFDKDNDQEKQKVTEDILDICNLLNDPIDISIIADQMTTVLKINKTDVRILIKASKKKSSITSYSKLKEKNLNDGTRYIPFIERSTSSYSYWDRWQDKVYLGVSKDILENILVSSSQILPDILPVLKVDFVVKMDERYDMEKEIFNLFKPSEYMLFRKTPEEINPDIVFPNINKLLTNLIPVEQEKELFINFLSGIMQTREKQLTAWIFKGVPGTGKGVLLNYVLKPLFGSDQAIQVENDQLHNDFNPWLQNILLIAFNEVEKGMDKSKSSSVKSKIKAIITDPEIIINEKHIKQYFITNHVNCIFFSNERIPVFIEEGDRRFNVVNTGKPLRSYPWFSKDPAGYLDSLKKEISYFAQFLMNWQYDPLKAKTCFENDVKNTMISASMNRYEEFAYRLKNEDLDWFEENITASLGMPKIHIIKDDISGKIRKEFALQLFNNIYHSYPVSAEKLGTEMKLYGLESIRITENNERVRYYVWN